jgi:hypothetical protein
VKLVLDDSILSMALENLIHESLQHYQPYLPGSLWAWFDGSTAVQPSSLGPPLMRETHTSAVASGGSARESQFASALELPPVKSTTLAVKMQAKAGSVSGRLVIVALMQGSKPAAYGPGTLDTFKLCPLGKCNCNGCASIAVVFCTEPAPPKLASVLTAVLYSSCQL